MEYSYIVHIECVRLVERYFNIWSVASLENNGMKLFIKSHSAYILKFSLFYFIFWSCRFFSDRLKCQNKSLEFQIQPNKKSDSIYYIGRFSTWYSDHKTKKEGRANKSVWYLHTWNLPGTNSHFQLKSLTCQLGILVKPFWWWDNRLQGTETPANSKKRRRKKKSL